MDYGCINIESSFKFSYKTREQNQSSTRQLSKTILSLTTLNKRVYYYCKGYFRRSKKSVYIRKDIFESTEFRTLNYVKKSNNINQSVLLQIHDISEAQKWIQIDAWACLQKKLSVSLEHEAWVKILRKHWGYILENREVREWHQRQGKNIQEIDENRRT